MIRLPSALLALMLTAAGASAQAATDVFLVRLPGPDTAAAPAAPAVQNLSARAGYDNQPSFTPDGRRVLYTVIDDAGQADIHAYDLAAGTREPLTRTAPESEYSAEVVPGNGRFSVVRVEADSTQRLWSFALADGGEPRLVLEDVAPVGYYAWGDAHTLALFVLGEPATLRIADTRTGEAETVARDIGRSIRKIPGRRAVSFAQRTEDGGWTLMELDLETREIRPIGDAPSENEHHAWTPDGRLLTASGTSILVRDPTGDAGWRTLLDLSGHVPGPITRLAVSPDGTRLAFVADETPPSPDD